MDKVKSAVIRFVRIVIAQLLVYLVTLGSAIHIDPTCTIPLIMVPCIVVWQAIWGAIVNAIGKLLRDKFGDTGIGLVGKII